MGVADNLRAAKALIEDREHWLQGKYATHEDGRYPAGAATYIHKNPRYTRFCSLGAVAKTAQVAPVEVGSLRERRLLDHAAWELYRHPLLSVNDDLGHEAVLAMFDKAIELAEEEDEHGRR